MAPLSIVIVGVGNADFDKMDVLDADDTPLRCQRTRRVMQRDIVRGHTHPKTLLKCPQVHLSRGFKCIVGTATIRKPCSSLGTVCRIPARQRSETLKPWKHVTAGTICPLS